MSDPAIQSPTGLIVERMLGAAPAPISLAAFTVIGGEGSHVFEALTGWALADGAAFVATVDKMG